MRRYSTIWNVYSKGNKNKKEESKKLNDDDPKIISFKRE